MIKAKLLPLALATVSLAMAGVNRPALQAARVIDGDTFVASDGRHVRLIGVDAPEKGECFAEQSTKMLAKLVMGQNLRLETDFNDIDQFGRTLAYVFNPRGEMLNEMMLAKGGGEYFHDELNPKYTAPLIAAAEHGYRYRAGRWTACASDKGCVIKGNLDKWDKRRYILPESRHYEAAKVNLDKYDRWFCSEDEATRAGFIKERL